ncbi:unnamed protein product [Prorocentrum cordatum]|uniref:phosphoinositide phospholipase C n=1 Tax=Prorocentrum cordatum TaxID=2364126 RepID=A0ABN9V793_9DINO|nr:unnamed protein product [Polarella glacialis]
MRGARCVEIDCWDGDDGEPMVTHGWTPTSRLAFQDVVRVCRDYGFAASKYPLILSLEVHCSPRQKMRMGQILESILGDQLLRLPEDISAGLPHAELVSPEAALRKVIVKGKLPKELQAEMKAGLDPPAQLPGGAAPRPAGSALEPPSAEGGDPGAADEDSKNGISESSEDDQDSPPEMVDLDLEQTSSGVLKAKSKLWASPRSLKSFVGLMRRNSRVDLDPTPRTASATQRAAAALAAPRAASPGNGAASAPAASSAVPSRGRHLWPRRRSSFRRQVPGASPAILRPSGTPPRSPRSWRRC